MEKIIQFLDSLAGDFSWKRAKWMLVFIAMIVMGVSYYESYTGHFRLSRIEQESELLDKLLIQEKNIPSNSTTGISEIHQDLIRDLCAYTNQSEKPFPSWILKMSVNAVFWLFLGVLITSSGVDNKRTTWLGLIIFSIPFIIVAGILPDFKHPIMNYFVYPVGSFITLYVIFKVNGKLKKSP